MTAFAFILGCVPLVEATGAGGISRQVLGTSRYRRHVGVNHAGDLLHPCQLRRGGALRRSLWQKKKHGATPSPGSGPELGPGHDAAEEGPHRMIARTSPFRRSILARRILAASVYVLPILALVTSGCKVGPNYSRPSCLRSPTSIATSRPISAISPPAGNFAEMNWQTVFQDEALQALIKEALTNNYDIRIAATRILQANAQLGITRANQLPYPQWRVRQSTTSATNCS